MSDGAGGMSDAVGALLEQLCGLAAEEGRLLTDGQWEASLQIRARVDACFTDLQQLTAQSPLRAHHAASAAQFQQLLAANLARTGELRDDARRELADLTSRSRLRGYAPLGATHRPSARYLDQSA